MAVLTITSVPPFAGAGGLTAKAARSHQLKSVLAGAGVVAPTLAQRQQINSVLGGRGLILPPPFSGTVRLGAIRFAGAAVVGGRVDPARLIMTARLAGSGGAGADAPVPGTWYNMNITLGGAGKLGAWLDWQGSDPINAGIVQDAGEQLLYRAASGLEKSLATVDAYQLLRTYAELVRDQWDPWKISSRNLGYLAWAMGVNLWEDDWSEQFRRYWVANQWTFKYYRGSDLGLKMAVEAVNANIVTLTRPPASFYPGKALTTAERQAYVARFPQLRLYPFAPRPQLPWLNYLGGVTYKGGPPHYVNNGRFFGPLVKFYPTNFNAGGLYQRACTLFDPYTNEETVLTARRVYGVLAGRQTPTYYDEVTLPSRRDSHFYPGHNKQYFLPKTYPLNKNRRHAIVLGILDSTPSRLVLVPRDGSLDITQFQAIFTTISTGLAPLNVRPELVMTVHPGHRHQFYSGRNFSPNEKSQPPQSGFRTFLCKSDAWQYLYERWYLFDATRTPDYRRANTYMGRSRFGIRKYSAEAKLAAFWHWPKRYSYYGGFIGPGRFFAPQNTKRIDQLRRAVTASMGLRDTVAINTRVKRRIQIKDLTVLDGRFSIGQWLTDSS